MQGCTKTGLDAVCTPERQTKALLNSLEKLTISPLPRKEDPDSQTDGLVRVECDGDNAVEEEVDKYILLLAATS